MLGWLVNGDGTKCYVVGIHDGRIGCKTLFGDGGMSADWSRSDHTELWTYVKACAYAYTFQAACPRRGGVS